MFKVPLSLFSDNDIALREDKAPIYGVMLPVKLFSLKSKIFKMLKFAISTKRIDNSSQGQNQDSNLRGAKLKTNFFFMKIKTNIYFIFNKILHIK